VDLPPGVPAVDSDPDDYPIVQTAITGQANVLCTRGQAFQHAVVQRVCAAHNIRVLDDVSLMRELRHAASQQRSLFGLSNNIGMRRADRLFQIVQHLRGRRLTTATELSQWLEASERTVYRDISDLSRSGVPIAGEAGSGYRILRGFEVPPLMFTLDEVEAPVIGVRIIESWGGPVLGKASRSAIEKIAMALPSSRLTEIEGTRLFAPGFHLDPQTGATLELIRGAIFKQCKLVLTYWTPTAALRNAKFGRSR
jgi:biotin operon repressor